MVNLNGPSSNADTLDARPLEPADSTGKPSRRAGFIEGSGPEISGETADLLRGRLRAAAGILGLAFGLFFVYRIFADTADLPAASLTFYFHFAVVIVLFVAFARLCRRCQIPLGVLRIYELAIFGVPVAYFLTNDYVRFSAGYSYNPLPFWMGIAFTYAMFIPNTWRRAAIILGIICGAPIVSILDLYLTNPAFAATLKQTPSYSIAEFVIMLGVTYLCGTYGTHMINTLRHEAFQARQLGQYRLCRLIGSGGMGEVYLAEHQMMKRPVAIKLIRPGKAADPQALARFEREVRATARLSHWNTIEIFDYGRTDDGTFYYVMEYLPGLSLADLVEKHGPLPPARAIHLLVQTCDALSEAHNRGLIHRDLKPGNVFSAQRGGFYDVAKLLDFGLAKPISTDNGSIQLTQEGSIAGSPLFMSPEQALGDSEPDARSDIYSLGAVAYYLLTGAPPFEGDKPMRVMLAHAHEPVVPPSRLRAEIPADVESVVMRCLEKNPADRYAGALELRRALFECVAAGGWTHDDAARWWRTNGAADVHAESMATAAL